MGGIWWHKDLHKRFNYIHKNKYGTVNRQEKVGGLVGQKDGGFCPF